MIKSLLNVSKTNLKAIIVSGAAPLTIEPKKAPKKVNMPSDYLKFYGKHC